MKYKYGNGSFYPYVMKEDYEAAGSWPENGVDVDEDVFSVYAGTPPEGKQRGTAKDGMPEWVDVPPPTKEELLRSAESQKQFLIASINSHINVNQWPSKLMLGRMSDKDKATFNAWLDYLDAANLVDTSKAPDITWPKEPE